jgi:hypothetical protein
MPDVKKISSDVKQAECPVVIQFEDNDPYQGIAFSDAAKPRASVAALAAAGLG